MYKSYLPKYFWQMTLGSCLLVGLFVPEHILTDHAWARHFCDFMASFIPHIERVSGIPIKPEINRFFYSFMWAVGLSVILPANAYERIKQYQSGYLQDSLNWRVFFKLALVVTFFIWMIYGMSDYSDYLESPNKIFFSAYSHWLARPFWAISFVLILATLLPDALMWLIYLVFIKPRMKNNHDS